MSIVPFKKPDQRTVGCALAEILRDLDGMGTAEFNRRIAALSLSDAERDTAARAFRLSAKAIKHEADAMELLSKCRRVLHTED